MTEYYVNLIKIILIVSFIVDYSGVMISIKKLLWRILMGKSMPFKNDFTLPLFECSLCVTFWSVLIYSIYNDTELISAFFAAIISAYIVGYISMMLQAITDIFKNLISKLYE